MADAPAPPGFTAAHKAVIDATMLAVALTYADDARWMWVWQAYDLALPLAHGTGRPDLDRLILAAQALQSAHRAIEAKAADRGAAWALAQMQAGAAVAGFAYGRLAHALEALQSETVIEGAAG